MLNLFKLFKRSKTKREIIINVEKLETRVAVMENGRLEEFMVEHPEEERLVGSVFKGRVQNLENDLQAAFIDIGLKKNAFLHYWDMTPDADALLDDEDEPKDRKEKKRVRIRRHVPVVEKRVLLEPDVDERGLQVVLQVLHASLEDAADKPFLLGMLDHELLEASVLENGDPGLQLLDVDDDFALHLGALE